MTWLARCHPDSAWAHLTTTDFPAVASRPGAFAVLPVHGFVDHGMGLPLDIEEIVSSALLADACEQAPASCSPVVLPPLRFGPAPHPASTFFGLPLDAARALLLELAEGVKFAGFTKLLLLSGCPWHREWLDSAGRDIRVATGLAVYRVHLASLGIDFHPGASQSLRLGAQALAATLLGATPGESHHQESADEHFRPGRWIHGPPLPGGPVGDTRAAAAELVRRQAGERLARLLAEIAEHGRGEVPRLAPPAPPTHPPFSPRPAALGEPAPVWRPFGTRYLGGLPREAMRAAAIRPGAVAIIPTGAIEQHGPHLPVGVDAMLGQGLLARALAALPAYLPAYVCPPVLVGKSNEHADWPGTLSLSAPVLTALVRAQVEHLHRIGFQRIAFFNTHGGNSAVLVPLIRELQNLPGLRVGMLQSSFKPRQSPQEAAYGFHAGEWETSLMLALAPSLVRRARAVCHYPAQLDDAGELRPEGAALTFCWTTRDIAPQGVIGDATLATPTQGEAWADGAAASLAERIAQLARV